MKVNIDFDTNVDDREEIIRIVEQAYGAAAGGDTLTQVKQFYHDGGNMSLLADLAGVNVETARKIAKGETTRPQAETLLRLGRGLNEYDDMDID